MLQSLTNAIRSSYPIVYTYGTGRGFLHRNIWYHDPTENLEKSLESFTATEILPHLWLGNIWDAHNVPALQHHNITHILTIITGVTPSYPDKFHYLHIDAMDVPSQKIKPFFRESTDFIHSVMHKIPGHAKGKYSLTNQSLRMDNATNEKLENTTKNAENENIEGILVHCVQGKSRSASLVAAYLMVQNGKSATEAIDFLQEKRSLVDPNTGFRQELFEFEQELKERQME